MATFNIFKCGGVVFLVSVLQLCNGACLPANCQQQAASAYCPQNYNTLTCPKTTQQQQPPSTFGTFYQTSQPQSVCPSTQPQAPPVCQPQQTIYYQPQPQVQAAPQQYQQYQQQQQYFYNPAPTYQYQVPQATYCCQSIPVSCPTNGKHTKPVIKNDVKKQSVIKEKSAENNKYKDDESFDVGEDIKGKYESAKEMLTPILNARPLVVTFPMV